MMIFPWRLSEERVDNVLFDYPKPFGDRGQSLNLKCVDKVFLALDDSSVTLVVSSA